MSWRLHVYRGWRFCLDTLFPPRSEERFVRTLSPTDVYTLYTPHMTHTPRALATFDTKTMRALMHEAKFYENTHAHILLAHLITLHYEAHVTLHDAYWIPIPLSPARLKARGYNQTHEILKHTTIPPTHIYTDVLVRTKDTAPQTTLNRSARIRNMDHVFTCARPERVTGKHCILIDDVTTTGATLRDAERALKSGKPASITLLAIAH